MQDLKPCVECGDENPWLRGNTLHFAAPYVECRCGHTSPVTDYVRSSVNIWNKDWEDKQKYDDLKRKCDELEAIVKSQKEPDMKQVNIDAFVVALDTTHEYNIDSEDAPPIVRIEGVYLFDRNVVTHTCEMAESYSLTHLYNLIVFADGLSDERREELEDKYAYEPSFDKYAHVSKIDPMIEEADPSVIERYPTEDRALLRGATYDDRMYAIREDCVCNHSF